MGVPNTGQVGYRLKSVISANILLYLRNGARCYGRLVGSCMHCVENIMLLPVTFEDP